MQLHQARKRGAEICRSMFLNSTQPHSNILVNQSQDSEGHCLDLALCPLGYFDTSFTWVRLAFQISAHPPKNTRASGWIRCQDAITIEGSIAVGIASTPWGEPCIASTGHRQSSSREDATGKEATGQQASLSGGAVLDIECSTSGITQWLDFRTVSTQT